jgi:ABC-type transporter Mla MlaB component
MLRISHASATDGHATLSLEGEISGPWVEELRKECIRALSAEVHDSTQLVLDLAGVSSIDPAGLALFRRLSTRGVVVTNCSPYVTELLKYSLHQTHEGEPDA